MKQVSDGDAACYVLVGIVFSRQMCVSVVCPVIVCLCVALCVSVCLPVCLFVCLSVCLFVHLSVFCRSL